MVYWILWCACETEMAARLGKVVTSTHTSLAILDAFVKQALAFSCD
ncbi:hypothetical protein NRI_0019 [Neorickettsia risticii str. Illinois]|uniref:Uncharacterized protein n=1 Tax=Neorickettsia risticii (strain Illinois) TaxID=434131 RepID=C6V3Q1_NEORI|nr:hypothetical protein NRI_0019 [Neorickettsia risticii str. Illinois]